MDVNQPRHHEIGRIVEHMVIARAPRPALLRADIVERAALIEHQGLAGSSLVLPSGEQMATPNKGFHCAALPFEGTRESFTTPATVARLLISSGSQFLCRGRWNRRASHEDRSG